MPSFAFAQQRDFTFDRVVNIAYGLIQFLFTVGWWIAVIMIVWFGLQMMISGSNAERYTGARRGLTWAIIGLAVIIGANILVLAIRRAVAGI